MAEPLACIHGFHVAQPAPARANTSRRRVQRNTSLLSLHLSTSPTTSYQSEESEEDDAELYSEDFEENASPGARAIIQKNEDYYKMMLRVRAVVNSRLWSMQGNDQLQQLPPNRAKH